jgi:hypothetical protein
MNIYDPFSEALGLEPILDISQYPSIEELLLEHPVTLADTSGRFFIR